MCLSVGHDRVQKRRNRSRCLSQYRHVARGRKLPYGIRWEYKWAPSGEYDWTIHAARQCELSLYHYRSNLLVVSPEISSEDIRIFVWSSRWWVNRQLGGEFVTRPNCRDSLNLSVFEDAAFACGLRDCLMPVIDLTGEAWRQFASAALRVRSWPCRAVSGQVMVPSRHVVYSR